MTSNDFLFLGWLVILTSILVDLHSGFRQPWTWTIGCFLITLALCVLAVIAHG